MKSTLFTKLTSNYVVASYLQGFEHPWDHGHDAEASHSSHNKVRLDTKALPVAVLSTSSTDESEEFDVLDDLHDVDEE